MLKKIMLFVCALLFASNCYAFSGTIDGFRGIKWGDSVSEINSSGVFSTELEKIRDDGDGFVLYKAQLANPNLGGVSLSENAICIFINGKFSKIEMFYGRNPNPDNCFYKLVRTVEGVWGITYDKENKIDSKGARWTIGDDYIVIESTKWYNGSRTDKINIGTMRYLQEYKQSRNGF